MTSPKSQLFNNVKYFITNDTNEEVKTILKDGGAKKEFYFSDLVTHVIADDENFPERDECMDKVAIRSSWVLLSHKAGYLLPTQPFSVLPVGLFGGLVVSTSGIRGDDYIAVWSMIRWNGGTISKTLSQKTTHLIVGSSQSPTKYKAAIANNIPVVVIEWVLDSLDNGAVLPTDSYALYIPGQTPPPRAPLTSPRITQSPMVTPSPLLVPSPLIAQQMPMMSQSPIAPLLTSPIEEKDEEKTKKRPPKKVTKKKKDNMVPNLQYPMTPAGVMAPSQQRFDSQYPPTPSPHPTTPHTPTNVSPDRYGVQQAPYMLPNSAQYMQYQQQNMIRQPGYPGIPPTRHQWSMYQQQMMSQQQQKQGYYNPAGQFPNQPVQYPGRRTPNSYHPMYQQQQHVQQQMVNQNMVNQVSKAAPTPPPEQPETKVSRYSTLITCSLMLIDYPEYYSKDIMNKWKIVIEEHGGSVATFYNPEFVTHIICMSRMSDIYKRGLEDGKCVTTAHWLNDVVIGKEYILPHNPLHIPTQFKTGLPDCAKMKISVTGYEGKERIYVKDMIRVIGAVYTGELSQQNTHLISRKSEGLKYIKAQKWGTKVVNARWLSDIVLYGVVSVTTEKKYTTLGDPKEMVLHETVMPKLIECWHNFSPLPSKDSEEPSAKKIRVETSPVILFTGLPSDKNQKLTQLIKKMRCKLTTDVREASHLVTCKIVRTVKFLSAISHCSYILTPSWIEQSCNRKMLLDESGYILEDKDSEQMLGFNVKESLQKSRATKVFGDIELYLTPRIQPGPKDMATIVECGGGKVISEQEAMSRLNQPADARAPFYVISCSQDQIICQQFYQKEIQIYTSEFVLSGALTQILDHSGNKLFVQDYKPEEQPMAT